MNETLLLILIVLMSLTLLTLAWAVIALLIVARRELPKLQRQVSEMNGRVGKVLEELVPTVQHTTLTLKEAERALHEAAETLENLHIVSDNIRHKLEVADAVGAKVRRLPEKTARWLGRLMHHGFKLGGQLLSAQIEKRLHGKRATVYDGVRGLDSPVQAEARGLGVPPKRNGGDDEAVRGRPTLDDVETVRGRPALDDGEDAVAPMVGTDTTVRAVEQNSAEQQAEGIPTGEATTHTTHKEG
ncbi:MAG: hypothetical protein NZM10_01810 [Fimbriimonadales bacterium]|nr:hypothetical protein [Fimbriimonadales bacterium]